MSDNDNIYQIGDYNVQVVENAEDIETDETEQYDDGYEAEANAETDGEDFDAENTAVLPFALMSYRTKLFALAAGLFVLGVAAAKYMNTWTPLLLAASSIYFVVKAVMVRKKYFDGRIREVPVICTSVRPATIRDRMTVSFKTCPEEDSEIEPEFFRFNNISKKKSDEFVVNFPYMIYFDSENPHALIGYSEL